MYLLLGEHICSRSTEVEVESVFTSWYVFAIPLLWYSDHPCTIWWDGDECRELLDGTTIYNVDGSGTGLTTSGVASNNGTKSTPCLQADILGDWREEVIFRTTDNRYLRIYTTTATTERKIYTLMHDPIYRLGIAWQNTAYNQPPHTGFYLGSGMSTPPLPNIYLR